METSRNYSQSVDCISGLENSYYKELFLLGKIFNSKPCVACLLIPLVLMTLVSNLSYAENQLEQSGFSPDYDIRILVESFGQMLQRVSLTAPKARVIEDIEANYADYITPGLLARWANAPNSLPGRRVSSPWPEGIDILLIEAKNQNQYVVYGEVIEISSLELINGGVAAKYPISMLVQNTDRGWLIDQVVTGSYVEPEWIFYLNKEYGFCLYLPPSWKGYSIVQEFWGGLSDGVEVTTGPKLLIRHPDWSETSPRQDIPIMVFSPSQWDALQEFRFSIGAAPIGPRKLDSNVSYIFALPARYNFAFLDGFEEVEVSLQTFKCMLQLSIGAK